MIEAGQRVLLKLSGEALGGANGSGIDPSTLDALVGQIKAAVDAGYGVAVVIGGGNIFRGVKGVAQGIDRASADYMGMLATVMNGIALVNALNTKGTKAALVSGLEVPKVAETYQRDAALSHFGEGRVVVFSGGTGNPFFTTDTAAALRAAEMDCAAILKGTQVDGVYNDDPKTNADAAFYERVSYDEVLANRLNVMDAAAIALARENNIPIIVFNIHRDDAFIRVLKGEEICTIVDHGA